MLSMVCRTVLLQFLSHHPPLLTKICSLVLKLNLSSTVPFPDQILTFFLLFSNLTIWNCKIKNQINHFLLKYHHQIYSLNILLLHTLSKSPTILLRPSCFLPIKMCYLQRSLVPKTASYLSHSSLNLILLLLL